MKEQNLNKIKGIPLNELYKSKKLLKTETFFDDNVKYSEIISEYILNEIDFNNIEKIQRDENYRDMKTPNDFLGNLKDYKKENLTKEVLIALMRKHSMDIMDFCIYIDKKNKLGEPKLDLLFEENKNIYLTELRMEGSTETLVTQILEFETKYNAIDMDKFKDEYNIKDVINKSIMIYKNSLQFEQISDKINYPFVNKLLKKLNIDVFILEKEGSRVIDDKVGVIPFFKKL